MMSKKEEFLERIHATFRIEAEENINSLYADLIKLEKEKDDSSRKELIEIIYRSVHSLKGASRAVDMSEIESVCHAFEGVMSAVREGNIVISIPIFDILHGSVDIISELLNIRGKDIDRQLTDRISRQIEILSIIESGETIEKYFNRKLDGENKEVLIHESDNIDLLDEIEHFDNKEIDIDENKDSRPQKFREKKEFVDSTIRVSSRKLDKLLFQAEDMLEIKLSAIERRNNLNQIVDKITLCDKYCDTHISSIQSINNFIERNDNNPFKNKEIESIIKFFEKSRLEIKDVKNDLLLLLKSSANDEYCNGVKIDNLLDDVKDVITVPFSSLFEIFPKIVRDIAKDLGKEVDLVIDGADLEIDRRVLEKIKAPMIHLLRNAIDYGLESVADRVKNSKSIKGKILIKVSRLYNNKVQVLLEDDGAGIDLDKIKKLYSNNENISAAELEIIKKQDFLNYIFKSGVSTSDIVTDISGRGIGLSIVKDNVEQLGGKVEVESEKGLYTRFKMNLPLSLVTYRGVIFGLSGNEYLVPTMKVDKVLRLNKRDVKKIENKDTFSFNGEIIPLINLSDILRLSRNNTKDIDIYNVIVISRDERSIGFIVESIIGEQEVLVKKFNKQLKRVKFVSGATILGSGKVVPILNISDIFKEALISYSPSLESQIDPDIGTEERKSILIVEDSVTSRMLLKNILEASDYRVVTAVDGIDGLTKLREETFDAVVSDIEMPRLNGFELTKKIRNDEEFKMIPVVLVTSLSKQEHKEMGIEAGANAYIVKSSFDHSNLLEILDRLI